MNYAKSIIIALLSLVLIFVPAQKALADYYYGGEEEEVDVLIDKMIKDPANDKFVDNLSISDYRFSAGQEVIFRLTIKNTGDKTLNDVEVKDIFPSYIDFVSDPGSWDGDTRTLRFEFDDLDPGESRDFEIKGRVVGESDLPDGSVCVTNKGKVWAEDEYDEDTAGLCIKKGEVKGAEVLPPTGPGEMLLMGALLLGAYSAIAVVKEFI
jgi:uncharacterized repeat protein (TIGR01451 family)